MCKVTCLNLKSNILIRSCSIYQPDALHLKEIRAYGSYVGKRQCTSERSDRKKKRKNVSKVELKLMN